MLVIEFILGETKDKPHLLGEHGFCCDWQVPGPWQRRRCRSNTCGALLAAGDLSEAGTQAVVGSPGDEGR